MVGFFQSMPPSEPLATDFGSLIQRLMFQAMTSALKSLPSWNLTPLRSQKVASLSFSSHFSARPGVYSHWPLSFRS